MNYLAHIFLSGNNSKIKIGNFIGDFVKGSKFENYPHQIRHGILLHRKIDHFTDSHLIVKEIVAMLRPTFGRYSGIIADMYFDYFLAVSFSIYSPNKSLTIFSFQFYFIAIQYYKHLPAKVKRFIFHFIWSNRLTQYSSIGGLQNSLEIMSNYKTSAINPELTISFLKENKDELEKKFHLFFVDVIDYVVFERELLIIN